MNDNDSPRPDTEPTEPHNITSANLVEAVIPMLKRYHITAVAEDCVGDAGDRRPGVLLIGLDRGRYYGWKFNALLNDAFGCLVGRAAEGWPQRTLERPEGVYVWFVPRQGSGRQKFIYPWQSLT